MGKYVGAVFALAAILLILIALLFPETAQDLPQESSRIVYRGGFFIQA